MTKKHLFIGLWIIALGITAIVYSVLPKTTEAKEPTLKDQCFLSWDAWSCVNVVVKNADIYNVLQKAMSTNSAETAKAKKVLCDKWLKEFCFQ